MKSYSYTEIISGILISKRVEKNGTLELAAVREVEEETGVKNLEINLIILKTTYHIFKRNGVYKLKETF